jgi:cytoskeletal protein RodZ
MSARQQQRLGLRRIGRDRAPIDSTPATPVGETLQQARERKGVDLYRAERDTKIRLRYLSALEDGDYAELPAPVYTKGFLRNYAIYLGLEPDEILDRWRDEMEQQRTATRVAVIPPPMPIAEPGGRTLHITPSMVVAGLVGLAVIAFIGYIGFQLLRFAEVTPLALSYPPDVNFHVDASSITLAGTTKPGARLHITGPGNQTYDISANETGGWTQEVSLARGENKFNVIATDRDTGRPSDPLPVAIIVPLPSPPPGSSATPSTGPPVILSLTVGSPLDGFVTSDQNVTVAGTTTGNRVNLSSTYLGSPASTPAPSITPSPSATPSGSPGPSPTPAPIGPARDLTLGSTGAFNEIIAFTPGRWQLTIVAYGTAQTPVARQVTIVVDEPGPVTHHLQLTIVNNPTAVKIVADGSRVANETMAVGTTREFTATNQFCVKTDNAASLQLVLDGQGVPTLGTDGEAGSWIVRSGLPPVKAARPC